MDAKEIERTQILGVIGACAIAVVIAVLAMRDVAQGSQALARPAEAQSSALGHGKQAVEKDTRALGAR